MSFYARFFRFVMAVLWYSFALTTVLVAAAFGLARLLLPMAGQYSVEVERTASEYVGQPIKVQSLDAEWHGFGPSLVLKGVRVLDKKGDKTIIQLSKARLGLDLIGSLIERQIRFSNLALIGANLYLIRHPDGHVSLAEFDTQSHSQDEAGDTAFLNRWIMGQGLISVEVQNLLFRDHVDKGRLFHLANVTVMLRNDGERHLVDAIASLPTDHSHKLAMSMDFTGNPLQGLNWSAKFYATGHRINFRKLFGVQKLAGYYATLGGSDFEFWGNWDHGRLDALKGEFALQDLWLSNHAPAKGKQARARIFNVASQSQAAISKPGTQAKGNKGSVAFDQLTGRIQWRRNDNGWRLQADRFVVSHNGGIWPASAFDVHYLLTPENKVQLNANASFVRIQDVLALQDLLSVSPDIKSKTSHPSSQEPNPSTQALNGNSILQKNSMDKPLALMQDLRHLAPSGDVKNLNLLWEQDRPQGLSLHAELENGSLSAWKKIPGFKGIKAVVDVRNDQGQVQFASGKSSIDMPALFRSDLQLNQLQGQVQWTQTPDAWTLSSRDLILNTVDMDSQMSFELELPTTDQSPFLNLMAKFNDGDGSHVSRYLPTKIMHASTVDWLDRAIVDAQVTSGGVVFHGNTRDFPFRGHQGEFEVNFNLKNGILDYAPQWPKIENIDANVVFHNEGMTITSNSATIFRSGLSHVNVSIPDMGAKPMQLVVKGDVAGETSEKLWYLQASPPLNRRFGKYLKGIHTTGSSDLGLNIDFRIGKDVFDADVNGLLDLHDNTIKVDPLGTLLTSTNGKVAISPDGLKAPKMSADLLGQPALLQINTVSRKGKADKRNILIAAKGDFDAKDLSQRYAPVLKELVSGKAAWQVNVDIPFHAPAQAQQTESVNHAADSDTNNTAKIDQKQAQRSVPVTVTVVSDLKGVESRLPAPFNKDKQHSLPLTINAAIDDKRDVNKVEIGNLLDGVVAVDYDGDKPVYRGEVYFGGGPVNIPERPGFRLYGHLKTLNVDVWRNLITQMASRKTEVNANTAVSSSHAQVCCDWLQIADLSVNNMLLYGQTLSKLEVMAKNDGEQLKVKLGSKQLSGEIEVPANLQTKPIVLNLDYLHLTSSALSSEGSVDPREIPAIKAVCNNVTYKERKFGSVRLETTRLAQGLRLEQLVLKPRETTITANGNWVVQGDKQKSNFDVHLTSNDLGKTMDDLDYVGSIEGGKGKLDATILWPGPLTDVDLSHLNGHVSLDFTSGRLLEVDPGGAGRRIFGLFSIQTLPRRLLLDFSDLFKKGFEFNEIKGDFNIAQGDAYTKDFSLEGPGVEAHMSGRIGLATQDYDQKVLVTPKVSDITALLTLLSSEPVLFIVQQLLRNKINQVASFEYKLTGPWDHYKLEPVQTAPPVSDKNDDDF